MMRVVFKDLESSEIARNIVTERIQSVIERFPDLARSRLTVTLSMQNSPAQAGPDLFSVKLVSQGGRYKDVVMEKSASNLYVALADLVEHLLERLNRRGDRARVKERAIARKATRAL